jgi:hypothetical protein
MHQVLWSVLVMARDDRDDEQPPYLVSEVARKFRRTEKAVRDGIAEARIPAFKFGGKGPWLIPRKWVDSQGGGVA